MNKLVSVAGVAFLTCISCGPDKDNGDDGGSEGQSQSSGGDSGSSGGTASGSGGNTETVEPAFPVKPLEGNIVAECDGQGDCASGLMGTWLEVDRCDRVGSEQVASSCGAVEVQRRATSLGGEVTFTDSRVSWLQSTVFDWSLEVDDTCGRACAEFATELTTEWSFLECAESGETCHCEGVNIENIEFEGSFTVSNDGLVITPAEALSDPSVPIYKVPVCADTQYLNVYSEELGNLVLSRKD